MLHMAALFGHTELCELLLNAGADVNIRNRQKPFFAWTPLITAAFCRQTKVCTLLLSRGADVNALCNHVSYSEKRTRKRTTSRCPHSANRLFAMQSIRTKWRSVVCW